MSTMSNSNSPTALETSLVLQAITKELRCGRHPLVTGPVGDRVLLRSEPMWLPDALTKLGQSAFDVVLRVNAVDSIFVAHGEEAYREILSGGSHDQDAKYQTDVIDQTPDRERRLVNLRERDRSSIDENDKISVIRRCMAQCRVSVLVVLEQADILLQDPAQHDQPDRERIASLQLALRESSRVGVYRNTCVLITGLEAGIPPVLLASSEEIGRVEMSTPILAERCALLRGALSHTEGFEQIESQQAKSIVNRLALLTDGSSLASLESLVAFSRAAAISPLNPERLVDLFRFGDRPDYWSHLRQSLQSCRTRLEARVFGQPGAINGVMAALSAAALGLSLQGKRLGSEGQPRGILWFVGPTGVGKTELAKEIANIVFSDREAYLRFDMSTFKQEHSAERLFGAPPGYVGFEQGGELSNAVRLRPNQVILLDEIEKAHPDVLDRFISIFEDGHIRDAQGRSTYFGETIIIATSNEGSKALTELFAQRGDDVTYEEVAEVSVEAVRAYFDQITRPEIFGRISPGVIPFDILRDGVIDRLTEKMTADACFENGPKLQIDVPSAAAFTRNQLANWEQRRNGGRQVRNIVDSHLRLLSSWLAQNGHVDAAAVSVKFEGPEMQVSVDGGPWLPVGTTW